jgi:predicted metalloprotease
LPAEGAEQAAETSVTPVTPATGGIDVGAFTQLLTAAQQCGMVPNADAIITARDREFRLGRYQRAFDVIEGLYLQLNAQIARRQGEWRRQEMQYKAGTLKLTPREWQLKQRQETELTQKVERARRQFTRLLDGLRVLRASQPE